jgi:peptide deformylase
MILPIYIYGNKILNTVGEKIDSNYPNLEQLIADMFETMKQAKGIGLAAQQIGLAINLFVIDIEDYKDDKEELKKFKKVFINSEILEYSEDKVNFEEGCLSVPGVNLPVVRPKKIRLKYCDENFVEHDEWFDNISSRCIQHEYDHIKGEIFLRKASPLARKMSEGKIKSITKGNFVTNYKYKI